MNRFIILSICVISSLIVCNAQGKDDIIYYLYDATDTTQLDLGHITLLANDSIAYSADIDEVQKIAFLKNVKHGRYQLEVDAFGYELYSDSLIHESSDMKYALLTPRKSIELNELTVTTDRSATATQTSGGMLFYLSEKARKMRDPFKALAEIPMLMSDIAKGSIETLSDENPKILVNGDDLNSGIAPLNPADIISVEVITNPPVRYKVMGYKSVINIKVRKKERPYLWAEANTAHAIPLDNGYTNINFEVGNPKVSLYGKAGFNYLYNNRTESETTRSNGSFVQQLDETKYNNSRNWSGSLMLKGVPDKQNNYAINISGQTSLVKTTQNGDGKYDALENSYHASTREPYKILEGLAYYRHQFSEQHTISGNVSYAYNHVNSTMKRQELFGSDITDIDMIYKLISNRISGQLFYNYPIRDNLKLGAGLNIDYINQRMNELSDINKFSFKKYIQYAYLSLDWSIKKFSISATIANEGTMLGNAGYDRSFWPFSCLVFADYSINNKNMLALFYSLGHTAPDITYLNPANTSTDPLQITCGNPYLRPENLSKVSLQYTYLYKKWYVNLNAVYSDETNGMNPYQYVNEDGLIVKTYANDAYFKYYSIGTNVNYRLPFGRIFVGGGTIGYYYSSPNSGNSYWLNAGFQFNVKRFNFYGNFTYRNKYVRRYGFQDKYKPEEFSLQCIYEAVNDLYIGVKVANVAGTVHDKTVTSNGDFYEMSLRRYCFKDIRPTLTLRYTIRANAKRRINLGEVLQSRESRISIAE